MDNCTMGWDQAFFIHLSWWPTAIILASFIVARFVWCPMKQKFEKQKLPPIPYEELYLISEDDKLLLNANNENNERENNFIIEDTPSGNVIMKYSIKDDGFIYWTDKTVSYKHLETVARKYVKTFHCVGIYIDKKEMVQQKKEKLEKLKKAMEERKEEKKDSIFATFKSYNKGGSTPVIDSSLYNPAAEKANKYINRGKFKEAFCFRVKSAEKQSKMGLDFASFKKLFESSA